MPSCMNMRLVNALFDTAYLNYVVAHYLILIAPPVTTSKYQFKFLASQQAKHRRRYFSLQEDIKRQAPAFTNTGLKDVNSRQLTTQVDARKVLEQLRAFLNTVAGRATAAVAFCGCYIILRSASKAVCGWLHGCAHFNRVIYYPAAAIVQIIAFFVILKVQF
eukprot:576502-Pleurochrysis_carterae.AAC.1